MVARSYSHIEGGGGANSFHFLAGGGGRDKFYPVLRWVHKKV